MNNFEEQEKMMQRWRLADSELNKENINTFFPLDNPVNNSVYLPFIKCGRLGGHRTQ